MSLTKSWKQLKIKEQAGGKMSIGKKDVSITVIRRLPIYYRYLEDLLERGVTRISSGELSEIVGFTASQIRQDLNNFGGFGQQGYGYNVAELYEEVKKILGMDKTYNTILVGAGNLGNAITHYNDFTESGFNLMAMFDSDPDKLGESDGGIDVLPIDQVAEFIRENNVEMAIFTLPKEAAQSVADSIVGTGVKGIWNFAPIDLDVPEEIVVEDVRLSESLYTLSYFLK